MVPKRYMSMGRLLGPATMNTQVRIVRACMTDGFWRGCADHVVRTACSTGLSSDSCIGCSDLLP